MRSGSKSATKTAFNFFVATVLALQMLVFLDPMVPVANAAAGTRLLGKLWGFGRFT
jgi:hypothetical protein